MGIRETVNRHKNATIGAACLLIVAAIAIIALQARGNGKDLPPSESKLFFTSDDGKTWFADKATNVPPFTKDGKEAVRAYVYRASDGTEFVGYVERYNPLAKQSIERALALPVEQQTEDPYLAAADGLQVKKPGDATWIGATDPRATKVQAVVSPKGASEVVTPVVPRN